MTTITLPCINIGGKEFLPTQSRECEDRAKVVLSSIHDMLHNTVNFINQNLTVEVSKQDKSVTLDAGVGRYETNVSCSEHMLNTKLDLIANRKITWLSSRHYLLAQISQTNTIDIDMFTRHSDYRYLVATKHVNEVEPKSVYLTEKGQSTLLGFARKRLPKKPSYQFWKKLQEAYCDHPNLTQSEEEWPKASDARPSGFSNFIKQEVGKRLESSFVEYLQQTSSPHRDEVGSVFSLHIHSSNSKYKLQGILRCCSLEIVQEQLFSSLSIIRELAKSVIEERLGA